jgi:AmmeMemoRadiSam system protein B
MAPVFAYARGMQAVRAPAVAGSFYPADATQLRETVARLLAGAQDGSPPKALIAPHAGYAYSGAVAASAFRRVVDAPVLRVVLLGPSHFAPLRGVALPGAAAMRTPLGDVPVEDARLPHDPRAHAEEHSLEVELPFLQVALRSFALVPLAVGDAAPDEVAGVIEQLWGGAETLIVVSSDLSHYHPYKEAQRADAATAKEILALGRLTPDDACGAAPVNGLLLAAKRRGLRAELIDLRNSGDTAGDRKRVVGYGAFAFYEK